MPGFVYSTTYVAFEKTCIFGHINVGSAHSVAVMPFFQVFKILWDSTSTEHFLSFTELVVEL